MCGAGVAAFVWDRLVRMTGNARPANVATAAGIAGLVAFIVLFSLFRWVLNV